MDRDPGISCASNQATAFHASPHEGVPNKRVPTGRHQLIKERCFAVYVDRSSQLSEHHKVAGFSERLLEASSRLCRDETVVCQPVTTPPVPKSRMRSRRVEGDKMASVYGRFHMKQRMLMYPLVICCQAWELCTHPHNILTGKSLNAFERIKKKAKVGRVSRCLDFHEYKDSVKLRQWLTRPNL